jgi:hypothetical protein
LTFFFYYKQFIFFIYYLSNNKTKMRYNAIAFTRPQTRTGNSGYLIPRKTYRQKGGFLPLLFMAPALAGLSTAAVASSAIKKQTGSGVIDQANMLYQQSKQGNGLKLAGAGVGVAGSGVNVAGGALDLPGGMLRMSLLDTLPKEKKKKKIIQSVGKDLGGEYPLGTSVSLGMGYGGVSGKGVKTEMAKSAMRTALVTHIIPKVLDKMGIADVVPASLIQKVVDSSIDKAGATIKDVVVNLSKKVMPILTHSKMAKLGMHSGSGFKKIAKSKKYEKLHGHLSKYLASKLVGQKGGSFWDDFVSGFMSVIKPAASILGPIASAVFPEFSPAISAVTGLIDKA